MIQFKFQSIYWLTLQLVLNILYFSIPDCINEMRSLLRDERRRVERYGETFCYPEIFELNNIKVKWDERKVLAKEQSSRSPEAKKKRKDSPPSVQ